MGLLPANDESDRFRQLVVDNQARLAAIARSYADRDWEDLLQETVLQIWRSRSRFRGDAAFSTWCYRIAINTAISWRRKRIVTGRTSSTGSLELDNLQGQQSPGNEMELVARFASTLSEIDRAVLLMHLDDFDSQAIADTLGTKPGAIRVRLHRIRQKLADWEPLDS